MKLYNTMKALAIDRTDFDVIKSKAYSLAELERYKEAFADIENVVLSNPG